MTVQFDTGPRVKSVHDHVKDWREEYGQGAYMLARLTANDIAEMAPEEPDAWYALGQTELALRRFKEARDAFEKAGGLNRRAGALLAGEDLTIQLSEVVSKVLAGLDDKSLTSAPRDPLAWLRDPDAVGEPEVVILPAYDTTPLGRAAPMIDFSKLGPLGSRSTVGEGSGGLLEQLGQVRIQRDTMASLLGKDSAITIEKGGIQIRDGSVKLEPPVLPEIRVFTSDGQKRDTAATFAAGQSRLASAAPSPPTRAQPFQPAQHSQPAPPARQASTQSPSSRDASTADRRPSRPATQPAARASAAEASAAAAATAAGVGAAATGASNLADQWRNWEESIQALVGEGRADEAVRRADEAVSRYSDSARMREFQATILQEAGKKERAARAWAEAHRRYVEAGAVERAEKAWEQSVGLAKENGDLLFEVASIAAAGGALGAAVGAGKLAADVYRRRDDRPKLLQTLKALSGWGAADSFIKLEMDTLASQQGGESSDSGGWGRTAPPSQSSSNPLAPPAHRTKAEASKWADETLARAAKADLSKSTSDPGLAFLFTSIVVLFLSLFLKVSIFGFIGAVATWIYIKASGDAKSNATAKTAKTLFIVAAILGWIL